MTNPDGETMGHVIALTLRMLVIFQLYFPKQHTGIILLPFTCLLVTLTIIPYSYFKKRLQSYRYLSLQSQLVACSDIKGPITIRRTLLPSFLVNFFNQKAGEKCTPYR